MPDGVKVVDFGIRGMHLAYDLLDGYDALVVIDALPGKGSPGDLSVLEVGPDDLGEGELDAHGMAPVAVLASLGQLGGSLPPTYVVGCQPADVGEGMGLTPAVEAAVEPAVDLVFDVLHAQLGLVGPASALHQLSGNDGEDQLMKTIGIVATSIVAIVAVVGAVVGLRSIGDVKRYLKMRSM